MNLSVVLLWHVLAIFIKNASGVCNCSTNNATTSMRTLSMLNYSNNENCTFYIRPSRTFLSYGFYLEIKWISFDIEGKIPNCYDFVEVFLTSAYKSIGKYCSDNMVANRPFDMYSHDGYAKIVFESDSWITRPGFSLTYQLKSNYSDASAAAIFYSSGWPYGYYASSTPCLRTYYVGANTLRVAVMDVSLYKRPLPYCNTTDSQFQIRASSRRFTTLSQFLSGATAVSGRICGTNTPTIYTAKNNYVYLYFNRPQPSTGYRGIMVGYIAYREDVSSSKSASNIGSYIGGAFGVVTFLATVFFVIICYCKKSPRSGRASTATQEGHYQTLPSVTYTAANTSANSDTFMQGTEPWQQPMSQSSAVFNEGNVPYPSNGLAPFPPQAVIATPNINRIPPPEYPKAIVPNSTYPMAPPPYSSCIVSSRYPPLQSPKVVGTPKKKDIL
eukprot:gene15813-7120_t